MSLTYFTCLGQLENKTALYYGKDGNIERIEELSLDSNKTSARIHLNSRSVFVSKDTYHNQDTTIQQYTFYHLRFPNNFYDSYRKGNYYSTVEWEDTAQLFWGEREPVTNSTLWERDTILTLNQFRTLDKTSRLYPKRRADMILNSAIDTSESELEFIEVNKVYWVSDSIQKMESFDVSGTIQFKVQLVYNEATIELRKTWYTDEGMRKDTLTESIIWESDSSFVFRRKFGGKTTYHYHYRYTGSTLAYFSDNDWTKYFYPDETDVIQAFLMDNIVFFDLPAPTIRYLRYDDPQPNKIISSSGDTTRKYIHRDQFNNPVSASIQFQGKTQKTMRLRKK